jgi:putative ubiquitin-RnfH superfamily antitoxin RatB of RatAB toxin-antitoxin module
MVDGQKISVKVAYALETHQEVISVELPVNSTVEQAIRASSILHKYREIELADYAVGIYGKVVQYNQILCDQDRVEIYRPLAIDPMQARRLRASLQVKNSNSGNEEINR